MTARITFLGVLLVVGLGGRDVRAGAPGEGGGRRAVEKGARVELAHDLFAELDRRGVLTLKKSEGNQKGEVRKKVVVAVGGLKVLGRTAVGQQAGMAAEAVPDEGLVGAWSLRSRPESGNARITQRAMRPGDALALGYDVNFREPEKVASWGYVLSLPASAAGSEVRVGSKKAELGGGARDGGALLRAWGRELRLLRKGKLVFRLLRDVPTEITVRDLGALGGSGFEITFAAGRADLAGSARGRFCLGVIAPGGKLPPMVYHARAWRPVRSGGPIRAEIGVLAEFRSPFDPAQISVDLVVEPPGGGSYRQPACFAREFNSRVETGASEEARKSAAAAAEIEGGKPEAAEIEHLEPVGEPAWRGLVDGREVGLYRISVEARSPLGTHRVAARPLRLVKVASKRMGPLARSKRDGRYLADPQGKAVFLLGHNLGWLVDKRGPLSLARWSEALGRMEAAGLNYARVWTCSWSLWTETSKPYSYDLASAWKLDRILEEAARRGIHVQLCLDNFHDFRFKRERSPYFAGKKPVCGGTEDFFRKDAALKMYSARLRYMVARYGHHQNLMGWELWNELDYCFDKNKSPEKLAAARKDYLVPWVRARARELAALDRRRRVVTCSLADGTIWPELTGAPEIGLAESHIYLYMPDPRRGKPAYAARTVVAEATAEFAKYDKPGFVSEFGFGASGGPTSPINDTDRLGLHLHNGLWASALSGHAGAVALWWWDSYLAAPGEPQEARTEITGEDRYLHYRSLGRFLRGVDWLAGWKKLRVPPGTPDGRDPLITGLRTRNAAMVWIADPRNTWHNRAVKKYKPARISGAVFSIDGLQPGEYQVTWWDTYSGKERTAIRIATDAGGRLRLKVPDFSRDVAARVRLVRELARD